MTTLGVITGLKFEADILRRTASRLNHAQPLTASVAGRQERAYEEALNFVEHGAKGLISFGIAGGLNDDAPVGTLVLATEVYCGQGGIYKTDPEWRRGLAELIKAEISPLQSPMISLPHALESEIDKREAHDKTGAFAVDMESFGVARAARETKVPFLVVRAVSDAAADTLPACLVPAMGPGGGIRLGPILKGSARQPADIPHLIKFGLQTRKANRTLGRVAFLGLPGFGFPV